MLSSAGLYAASALHNLLHDRERLGAWRAGLGPGFWGRVVLGGMDFLAAQVLVSLTFWMGGLPFRQGGGEGPPVILVHGLYHNPSAWLLFRRVLRREGFANVYTFGYNSFTRTYADLVHELTRHMEAVLRENPNQKLALVGHSLGGLIIRGAMADDRFKGRIAAVVTLGTPHRGSALAALGIGRLARQLRPSDHIFQQLAAQRNVEGVAKLSLFAPVDNMVFPVRCLEVDEPGWQQECRQPSVSHQGMIYDRGLALRTVAHLRECLESGWF